MKMINISIYIPDNYEKNIQKLKRLNIVPNRSEAIRTAILEFLIEEYSNNLKALEFEIPKNNNIFEVKKSERGVIS